MLSRLYTAVLVLLVAWSSWAVYGETSIIVCTVVFGFALAVAVRSWTVFLLFLISLVLLGMLLVPAVQSARESSRRSHCANNLRQISLAVLNYENAYKCFPPAYIADKNGKPMHSWRVLILPFLEHNDLYHKYDFNEPWDGPHNRKLLAQRPRIYVCPADDALHEPGNTYTSYVAIVGLKAAWPGARSRSLAGSDLGNRASSTILLAETADAGINWMEPRDISLDAIRPDGSSADGVTVTSKHGCHYDGLFYEYDAGVPAGANVAFADGHGMFLGAGGPNATKLVTLLEIGDGKDENCDEYAAPNSETQTVMRVKWRECAFFAVWLVPVGLLFHRAYHWRRLRQQVPNSCP